MDAPNNGTTSNIFAAMTPMTKNVYPTPSQRKKRFAKIREKIEGKR
jgi:hypothetical protein